MITPRGRVVASGRLGETIESIRAAQSRDGMITWFAGGHADPWNHVEAAMALTVGGALDEAGRAYEWLRATRARRRVLAHLLPGRRRGRGPPP